MMMPSLSDLVKASAQTTSSMGMSPTTSTMANHHSTQQSSSSVGVAAALAAQQQLQANNSQSSRRARTRITDDQLKVKYLFISKTTTVFRFCGSTST
jgi:hypothetical protein